MRSKLRSILPLILSFPFLTGLQAEDKLLIGKILQFGKLLATENAYVPIESNEITSELSKLNDKTVRILCNMKGSTCNPIRYEIFPFLDSKEIKPWTIKKIPDYVNHNIFAFNPNASPDGKYLFWTAYIKRGKSGTQKIWFSKLDEKGFWEDGKEMSAPLNNEMPSAVISALPGGNELFVFGTFGERELLEELSKDFESKGELAARSSKNSNEYRKKSKNSESNTTKDRDRSREEFLFIKVLRKRIPGRNRVY